MYESSGSQFLRNTTGIKARFKPSWELQKYFAVSD